MEGVRLEDGKPTLSEGGGLGLSFLPYHLLLQCRSLIQSYHEVHGFGSLPNMLWQFRMGPLIEGVPELRHLLRRASTTRSTKKANHGFVQIAASILAMEILASNFSGWSSIYPEAGEVAASIRRRSQNGSHMPLMDFYFYPPKFYSTSAVVALAPPDAHILAESQNRGPISEVEAGASRPTLPLLADEGATRDACL